MKVHSEAKQHDITLIRPNGANDSSYRHITPEQPLSKSHYREFVLERIREIQPNVVQVENRPDFALKMKRTFPNLPVILNLHSTTFVGPRHVAPNQVPVILKACDKVVFNSHYLKEVYKRRFRLGSFGRDIVIYPGVEKSVHWTPSGPTHSSSSRPLKLLFVGRVIRQKGLHVLISAVNDLRKKGYNVELTIVGRTPAWQKSYEKSIQNMIRDEHIRRVGFVAPKDLAQYYNEAHVFICPSQRDEAFGLVNLEALSAGLPVIASAQGGIPEIITSNCGILVRNFRQPSGFERAIRSLYAHPNRLESLRKRTKKRAMQFTWNRTARSFQAVYEDLAKRYPRAWAASE